MTNQVNFVLCEHRMKNRMGNSPFVAVSEHRERVLSAVLYIETIMFVSRNDV